MCLILFINNNLDANKEKDAVVYENIEGNLFFFDSYFLKLKVYSLKFYFFY